MIEVGATLKNGALVLASTETWDGGIVLAYVAGAVQPFVTWRVYDEDTVWGHYFADLVPAVEDYRGRTAQGRAS